MKLVSGENKTEQDMKEIIYKAETHRWFVLLSLFLLYFFWVFEATRTVPLTAEYALFFQTTNEVQFVNTFPFISGVDCFVTLESFLVLIFYPLSGYIVDNYGLIVLKLGALGFVFSTWIWFLADNNFNWALFSKFISSFAGTLSISALLRLSNQWFPSNQRALAVALGAMAGVFGAGGALIVFPGMTDSEPLINFQLESCEKKFREEFFYENPELVNLTNIDVTNLEFDCPERADELCCKV
eukprot:snap_masked-scaffold_2-processed-gene-4.28-mRNA-1 protein AED:1.00 eAED:1.00 QI:0/0/0/0/1/1/2/0/240